MEMVMNEYKVRYIHFIAFFAGKRVRVTGRVYPKAFWTYADGSIGCERIIISGRAGSANCGRVYHDISYSLFLKLLRMDHFEMDETVGDNYIQEESV
jgi:hypothetical protein